MFQDLIGSLGARFFGPGVGFTPIQPKQIQAVYFPAWFVDAELAAGAWVSQGAEDGDSDQVHLGNMIFVKFTLTINAASGDRFRHRFVSFVFPSTSDDQCPDRYHPSKVYPGYVLIF